MSKNNVLWNITMLWIIKLLILFTITKGEGISDVLHRGRRQLLFPNVTLLQCNFGVGTPSPHKLINVNWAIQTNFNLPWNTTQIPLNILYANSGYVGTARKKREEDTNIRKERIKEQYNSYDDDTKLHHIYKFVEEVLNGFGYNGTSCWLRTLCQLAAEPLHSDDEEDLLHEVASFLSNPSNTESNGLIEDEAFPYIEAYDRGKMLEDCVSIYDCAISIVDWFSHVAD